MKTIEKSPTKNEQGAIGIGAMIVFIALILVAAVASAVIIQTAEKLQQTAQQTGDDTEAEMGTKVLILSATVSDAANTIILTFELAAGSDTVAETAVGWSVVCDNGANAIATDDADFSDATTLGAAGAAASFVPGTAYELPIALANCGVAASTNYNLLIAVTGGGITQETLSTGLSVAAGSKVI